MIFSSALSVDHNGSSSLSRSISPNPPNFLPWRRLVRTLRKIHEQKLPEDTKEISQGRAGSQWRWSAEKKANPEFQEFWGRKKWFNDMVVVGMFQKQQREPFGSGYLQNPSHDGITPRWVPVCACGFGGFYVAWGLVKRKVKHYNLTCRLDMDWWVPWYNTSMWVLDST